MSQYAQSAVMPAYPGLDEPVSVLAARTVRAGLLWRYAEALRRQGTPPSDGKQRMVDRHALERGVPPTGLQPPELARFFQRYWPLVRAHTDTDRFRAESLLSVLWRTRDVEGDIVECGSYRGGLGFLFAFAVREWGPRRTVYLYDSFEGLPPLSEQDQADSPETLFYQGQFKRGDLMGQITQFLDEHDLSGIVELRQGWFEQTLPQIAPEQRFCFAHIDCDLYESARTCWAHLLPRMSAGAGVVIDDYDSYGMYTATWEYLDAQAARAGAAPSLYVGALKQAHFFAGPPAALPAAREDWTPLLANRPYRAYLAGLCGEMILACSGPPQSPRDESLLAALDRILGAEHRLTFLEYLIAFLYHDVPTGAPRRDHQVIA